MREELLEHLADTAGAEARSIATSSTCSRPGSTGAFWCCGRSTGRRPPTSWRRSSATRRCTRSRTGTTCATVSSRPDRRCYGFFHPQLVDEPLIFVEVALTTEIPGAIAPLLDLVAHADRRRGGDDRGVLLDLEHPERPGRRLLRQLSDQAGGRRTSSASCPNLKTFVTLSPGPGLRRLAGARAARRKLRLVSIARRGSRPCAVLDEPGWQRRSGDGGDRAPACSCRRPPTTSSGQGRPRAALSIRWPGSISATARGSSG